MVARVLRRLHDTTRELFVLVMREGVRNTTEARIKGTERERERKGREDEGKKRRESMRYPTSHTGR